MAEVAPVKSAQTPAYPYPAPRLISKPARGPVPLSRSQVDFPHSDPRLTTETYGHLVRDYLRTQIDRLSFGPALPPRSTQSVSSQAQAVATREMASFLLTETMRLRRELKLESYDRLFPSRSLIETVPVWPFRRGSPER